MKKAKFEQLKKYGRNFGVAVGSGLSSLAVFAGELGDAATTEIGGSKTDVTSAGTALIGVFAVICVVGIIITLMRR